MLKGLAIGALSALALSAVLSASASLLVPLPDRTSSVARTVPAEPERAPDAPARIDATDAAPRRPEGLPAARPPAQAPSGTLSLPQDPAPSRDTVLLPPRPGRVTVPSSADLGVSAPDDDTTETEAAEEGGTGVMDRMAVPAGSRFSRPPEDGVVQRPSPDRAMTPAARVRPLAGSAPPIDAPVLDTGSLARPAPAAIAGFGEAPEEGSAPVLPQATPPNARQSSSEPARKAAPRAPTSPRVEAATPEPPVFTPPAGARPDPTAGQVEAAEPRRRVTTTLVPILPREVEPRYSAPPARPGDDGFPTRLVLQGARGVDAGEGAAPRPSALTDNAVPFDRPGSVPLLAVVLVDPAGDADSQATLAEIGFPVTFAVDPAGANATEAAAAYRAGGHEVMLLGGALAPAGAPQDIEVALTGARAILPYAVAVLDGSQDGFAEDREALAALLPALEEAGLGFVAHPSGLGSGVAMARRAGVAAVALDRDLGDGNGRSSADAIARTLDRVRSDAGRRGAAIVVGEATSATVDALRAWRSQVRGGSVALAPISAVLRAASEEADGG